MSTSMAFQSTLPVWGATMLPVLPAWGMARISIHAPRVGSDLGFPVSIFGSRVFQSTLPVWGATDAAGYLPKRF